MKYIVVEKKEGIGWVEILECSLQPDAEKVVVELYRECREAKTNREFKVITLEGEVVIPPDKPRPSATERINEKLSTLFKL